MKEIKTVITANHLRDGRIVWRTNESFWSLSFKEAQIFSENEIDSALAEAKKDENNQIVTNIYSVELSGSFPRTTREKIRALGPNVLHASYFPVKKAPNHG